MLDEEMEGVEEKESEEEGLEDAMSDGEENLSKEQIQVLEPET